ncbi:MAG: hypothetical protein KIT87_07055 [Anaerolineae bacterium]|nr:hypothetical protein [Anaerolineae bacterium]
MQLQSKPGAPGRRPRVRLVIPLVTLSLMAALALAGFVALSSAQGASSVAAPQLTGTPSPTPAYATSGPVSSGLSLRTYGYLYQGAGDYTVITRSLTSPTSPLPGFQGKRELEERQEVIDQALPAVAPGYVEDKPYTDVEAPFNPQHPQAPRHDSITWNPAIMSEVYTPDENERAGLYRRLFATGSGINIAEKVWRRHWYEPDHLDKDQDASGDLSPSDIHYPAIMQEYTYGLIGNEPLRPDGRPGPLPIFARPGGGTFIFPIGQRASELLDANGNFPSNPASLPGSQRAFGLTSLDADFDGAPDITFIESEQSLFNTLNGDVALDFNGNGALDPLDTDGVPLSGDELLVLRLDPKTLDNDPNTPNRNAIQFLDHVAVLRNNTTSPNGAQFDIYWTGSFAPRFLGTVTLGQGDALLANVNGAPQVIRGVGSGAANAGGNLCAYPNGPWFLYLEASDAPDNSATVIVGRALGATHTAMESAAFTANTTSTQPWWLKRIYVDGREYNTVAISTRGAGVPIPSNTRNGCGYVPAPPQFPVPADPSEFTSITIREPVCKGPDIFIFQHSVTLQCYLPGERLPSLPPFNYEHYILADVQPITQFSTIESQVPYLGPLVGPVSPILQDAEVRAATGATTPSAPYTGSYPGVTVGPYSDPAGNSFFYVQEDREPQFLGELSERYAQALVPGEVARDTEFWYTQHYWTLPDEFTAYILPNIPETTPPLPAGQRAVNPDLYLLTSSFLAPEGEYRRWTYDNPVPADRIGDRAKFWFDPDGQPAGENKIYKDANGIRIYGRDDEGPGDPTRSYITTTVGAGTVVTYPVEVLPYTDYLSIFDPRGYQAPPKDSLTLNPAYLAEFRSGNEPLSSFYGLIAADNLDAREKVFPRLWYEPNYLDKILRTRAVANLGTETESNNSCQVANAFDAGTNPLASFNGSIPAGDLDFYRFRLTESRDVVIWTTGNPATDDTYLELYAACDNGVASGRIAFDDDGGPGFLSRIEVHLLPGTYYVLVRGFSASTVVPSYGVTFDVGAGPQETYRFPAVMQEYTYMFLDVRDQPATTGPGGRFFFPTATDAASLPLPPANASLGWSPASPSHGAGLTTFDVNFDGIPETVYIEHEQSLAAMTGIQADFNANGRLDQFDPVPPLGAPTPLSGDEMVIFRTEGLDLVRGTSAQFLDYMVRLVNVDYISGRADLQIWYTGGGLHPANDANSNQCADYSKHPDFIRTITLSRGEMAIVDRNSVRRMPVGSSNVGANRDGAWFAYVQGVSAPIPGQPQSERVSVVLGRALGAAAAAIDNGAAVHSFAPGLPWYLKRFFVDGHEYNVTAVLTPPGPGGAGRFKAITIQTPAPKPCDFVNYEDSIVLQGYFQGAQYGVDTNLKSVMPPLNMEHTILEDIRPRTTEQFARYNDFQSQCTGAVVGNRPPLRIQINSETREPRFFGELKEQEARAPLERRNFRPGDLSWATEQFNTLPDQYTDLGLPAGEYYLLTSSWQTKIGRLSYRSCNATIGSMESLAAINPPAVPPSPFPVDPVPFPNGTWPYGGPYYQASPSYLRPPWVDSRNFNGPPSLMDDIESTLRVQFWYTPTDGGPGPVAAGTDVGDIYVNRWTASSLPPAPTITATPTPTNTAQPGPTRTPTPTATAGATGTCDSPFVPGVNPNIGATLRILPAGPQVEVGQPVVMCVYGENVRNIYGLDIQLQFNGAILSIQDADPNQAGVNVTPGNLPAANSGGSITYGENNVSGNLINYAASLVAPSQPMSGSGVLFKFTVVGLQQGSSTIQFNAPIQLLDNNVNPVQVDTVVGATVNVTTLAGVGAVQGRLIVQGRTNHAEVDVKMGSAETVTDESGMYSITSQQGTYDLKATLAKYLPSKLPNVIVPPGGLREVPVAALRGGDANGDGSIDLYDMVLVAVNFNTRPAGNPQADINNDGAVDIVDLVLVGANFGYSGEQVGFMLKSAVTKSDELQKAAPAVARVSVDAPRVVKAGEEFKVPVVIRGAKGLFAADVSLSFDSTKVEVVDSDAAQAGAQGTAGELLPNAYVATNKADAGQPGAYQYAATRMNPDKAVDGDGALVTVTFRAVKDGNPQIKLTEARLMGDEANSLPSTISSAK